MVVPLGNKGVGWVSTMLSHSYALIYYLKAGKNTHKTVKKMITGTYKSKITLNVNGLGASLVAQWLKICCQCRWQEFEPQPGKEPHATEQLSPLCATTTELACHNYWACMPQLLKPTCLEPVLCSKRSHCNEKPEHRNEEWPPHTTTRESLHTATNTQQSQK